MKALFALFVVLLPLALGGTAEGGPEITTVPEPEVNKCTKFALRENATVFNETIQKCVVGLGERCDPSWPDSEYQCGSGGGGICGVSGRRVCGCPQDHFTVHLGNLRTFDLPEFRGHGRGRHHGGHGWSYPPLQDFTCAARRTLGESCADSSGSCQHGLSCLSNVCTCQDGEWNGTRGVCLGPSYCNSMNLFYDPLTKDCSCYLSTRPCPELEGKPAPCPPNSTLTGGRCECGEGMRAMWRDRRCGPVRRYDEACEMLQDPFGGDRPNDPCRDETSCIEGKCRCGNGRIWDFAARKCAFKAGDRCQSGGTCAANMRCTYGSCSGCQQRYRRPSGHCGQGYGGECSRAETGEAACAQGLRCVNRRCVCPNLFSQVYDEGRDICLTVIGGPCSTVTTCVDLAHCNPGTGRCECNQAPGERVPLNRTRCFRALPHGEHCYHPEHACEAAKGLVCDEGTRKCECASPELMYHPESGACLSREGGPCGEHDVAGNITLRCQAGLECREQPEEDGGHGLCQTLAAPADNEMYIDLVAETAPKSP